VSVASTESAPSTRRQSDECSANGTLIPRASLRCIFPHNRPNFLVLAIDGSSVRPGSLVPSLHSQYPKISLHSVNPIQRCFFVSISLKGHPHSIENRLRSLQIKQTQYSAHLDPCSTQFRKGLGEASRRERITPRLHRGMNTTLHGDRFVFLQAMLVQEHSAIYNSTADPFRSPMQSPLAAERQAIRVQSATVHNPGPDMKNGHSPHVNPRAACCLAVLLITFNTYIDTKRPHVGRPHWSKLPGRSPKLLISTQRRVCCCWPWHQRSISESKRDSMPFRRQVQVPVYWM